MIEVKGKNIVVTEMDDTGEKLSSGGIIIPGEGFSPRGIHPRWCKVYKVGSDIKDVHVGEWLYVEHGRWTPGIDTTDDEGNEIRVWVVDHDGILIATDERPVDA